MAHKKHNESKNLKKNQEILKFSPVLFLTFTSMNKISSSFGSEYHMLFNRIILLGKKIREAHDFKNCERTYANLSYIKIPCC